MKSRAKADEVLNIYQRISPSSLPIEEKEVFERVHKRLRDTWFGRLKFHPRMFRGANYANFGCGTGEQDMVYAGWGARGFGIDFNDKSIERANALKAQFGFEQELNFEVQDVLNPRLPTQEYDLVLSDGVLSHVEDPQRMLENMADHVKSDGFLLLGYLDQAGNVQRLIHGVIAWSLAQSNSYEAVEDISYRLFKDHLDRCAQFGGRTVKAVINDYILNKHSYGLDTVEIVKILMRRGLRLNSGYPLSPGIVFSNPTNQIEEDILHQEIYIRFQQLAWMFARDYNEWDFGSIGDNGFSLFGDLDRVILRESDVGPEKIIEELRNFGQKFKDAFAAKLDSLVFEGLDELALVLNSMQEGSDPETLIGKLDRLFRGFNGFSTCYLSFYRA